MEDYAEPEFGSVLIYVQCPILQRNFHSQSICCPKVLKEQAWISLFVKMYERRMR